MLLLHLSFPPPFYKRHHYGERNGGETKHIITLITIINTHIHTHTHRHIAAVGGRERKEKEDASQKKKKQSTLLSLPSSSLVWLTLCVVVVASKEMRPYILPHSLLP